MSFTFLDLDKLLGGSANRIACKSCRVMMPARCPDHWHGAIDHEKSEDVATGKMAVECICEICFLRFFLALSRATNPLTYN